MSRERRSSSRKPTNANFLVINCTAEEIMGRALDLSLDGLLLGSESAIDEGLTVPCHMTFPYWHKTYQFVTFEATCRWCKKNVLLDWYESGWSIDKMSDLDRKILSEVIAEWQAKGSQSVFRVDVTKSD